MSAPLQFDVFLCHNSEDKPAVIQIAEQLRAQGISPWLDIWELRPGHPWQVVLEQQIEQIHSAAVFVGSKGLGPWQRQEIDAFLREFVNRNCPVIPVLLPNAPQEPKLPLFLRGYMWVDFRQSQPDPIAQLIWGITGQKPKPKLVSNEDVAQVEQPMIAPKEAEQQQAEKLRPPQHNQAADTDDLSSDGVDYTRLRDLLKAGKWKEADRETLNVMLKVADRVSEGWLNSASIESFPCTDLRTINQLWVDYSKGLFGFSVQKKIWQEVNGDYEAFCDRVGWRVFKKVKEERGWILPREVEVVKKVWLLYSNMEFGMTAPRGHLPIKVSSTTKALVGFNTLFSRIETCM